MEWNLPGYMEKNYSQNPSTIICVSCLARDGKFIYLNTCAHSSLFTILFGNMLKDNVLCLSCHKMLLNFHLFKLQVEESIQILNQPCPNLSTINKLHSLKSTKTEIYDTPYMLSENNTEDSQDFPNKLPIYPLKNENVSLENKNLTLQNDVESFKIKNSSFDNAEDNLNNDYDIVDSLEEKNKCVYVKEELSVSDVDVKQTKPIRNKIKKKKERDRRKPHRKKKSSSKVKKNRKTVKTIQKEIKKEDDDASTSFVLSMRGEPLRYSCDRCGRMFQWKCHLKRHIAGAHVTSKLQCPLCAKVFKNDLSLRRHVKYIHERKDDISDQGPVQCPICLNMFKMKKTLRVHLKRMHRPDTGKDEERYCVECNKLFKSKVYYELHLKTSLKHGSDRYECDDCGKKFSLKGNLVEHIKRLHLKSRNHACNVCGKLFYKEYLRRLHEQHSHLGVPKQRNHMCSLCGKAFTCSQVLKRHMIIHSGVKPFQCLYCPSKFTQKSTLKTHCKFKHKDVYQSAKTIPMRVLTE